MGVQVSDEQHISERQPAGDHSPLSRWWNELNTGVRQLSWGPVLIFGIAAGLLMPLSVFGQVEYAFIAGLVPVGSGLLVARRVKHHYGLHGFMTGLLGSIVGTIVLGILIFVLAIGVGPQPGAAPAISTPDPVQLWLINSGIIAVSLLSFCTFGASMAGRGEERRRQIRQQLEARGGSLERPSTVRTEEDLRGLSLPQLGWYVNNLFKKNGFQFSNYRFVDKDKHLDLWLSYEGEPWHLRLSVADKVSPGTIEGLYQEMKKEGCTKGIVLTSTEFLPSAMKAAKGRPIVLIDGKLLFQIAEN